jgi:hypothetical protein
MVLSLSCIVTSNLCFCMENSEVKVEWILHPDCMQVQPRMCVPLLRVTTDGSCDVVNTKSPVAMQSCICLYGV